MRGGRIGITALLECAPIDRVRVHWPAHAAELEVMRLWRTPRHVEEFLMRVIGPVFVESGNRLRSIILWGDGAPPSEADTCILREVRVHRPGLTAELEAAGFAVADAVQNPDPAETSADQDDQHGTGANSQAALSDRNRPRRQRGPFPRTRLKTESAMKQQIARGERSLDDLDALTEASMEAEFGVSRDTARRARNNVLMELRAEKLDKLRPSTNSDRRKNVAMLRPCCYRTRRR